MIYIVNAGYVYRTSGYVAGSGEDGGWEYHYTHCDVYIKLNQELSFIDIDLAKELYLCLSKYQKECDFYEWAPAGDSAKYEYDDSISTEIAQILSNHLIDHTVIPLSQNKAIPQTVSNDPLRVIPPKPIKFDFIIQPKLIIEKSYFDYLSEAKFQKIFIYKNSSNIIIKKPNEITPHIPNNKNKYVSIVCGYTFPFKEYFSEGEGKIKCVCSRSIFTIYIDKALPINRLLAEQINFLIGKLSVEKNYEEIQDLPINVNRFIYEESMTNFIINLFHGLFDKDYKGEKYIFKKGNFDPMSMIEFSTENGPFGSNWLKRHYCNCINFNDYIYSCLQHNIERSSKRHKTSDKNNNSILGNLMARHFTDSKDKTYPIDIFTIRYNPYIGLSGSKIL